MKTIDTTLTRADLASRFIGVGAEIGVERAVFSKVVCEAVPGVRLYGIDPLAAYKGYREHVSQDKLDGFYNEVMDRMRGHDFHMVRKYSMDALVDFADESLDFVYIDANHDYEHTTEDITGWAKKVKKGGIVAGHDYIKRKGQDHLFAVVKAVQDYSNNNGIEEVFICRGDKSPSWYFIKK
jgi:hypothetical protein